MRAAIYARVSTPRQARDRKTDQQVARLEQHAERQGWVLGGGRVYLDEGYSGASLNRPGLDALRDAAAMATRAPSPDDEPSQARTFATPISRASSRAPACSASANGRSSTHGSATRRPSRSRLGSVL